MASAVLASEGLRVVVLEKNAIVGGVCATYEKRGFRVDMGTHLFSRGGRGPLGTIARRVGAKRIRFRQTRDLVIVKSFGAELRVPRDAQRMPAFILDAIAQLRLGPRDLLDAGRFLRAVLNFDEARLSELDRVSMWEFVTGYTNNPRLVGLFGFLLGLYFILPLNEVSAGEGIWCFRRMVRRGGLSYPMGGATSVPQAFLDAAVSRGATVHVNRRVTRVVVEAGRARGVECADGAFFEADCVVGTASLKDHVEHLVGPEHFPDAYVERVRSLKSSMIAVQAKLALRRPLVHAGCLVGTHAPGVDGDDIGLDDFERMYEHIATGKVAPVVPIYAPVPSNFDPSLAPPGGQLITACAVAPTTDIALRDSPEAWTASMMAALRSMIPNLDDELLWVDTLSTKAIGRWNGKLHAPAVSAGQTPDQVGNRRPPVHTPIRGLYTCGCGAGARGVGTELAAASAQEAADRVVQDRFNGLL